MSGVENSTREMAGRSYLIATEIVPDKPYALSVYHSIRAVKSPPGNIADDEKISDIRRMDIMMALSGSDPLNMLTIYKDLIVFHSFLTYRPLSSTAAIYWQESGTYFFAERTNKALYDDSEIESIDPSTLNPIGVNFDHFPVAINVGMKPVFRYTNYRYAFSVFLGLKHKAGTKKIQSENKRLYDQIHLWEFARNCVSIHKIYSNDYLPIALCMTILESLVGRPKRCENRKKCKVCNRPTEHDAVSWSKHFRRNYIRRVSSRDIELISKIRNDMYHRGNFFDWFEEYDKVIKIGEKANKKDTNHLDDIEFVKDKILQISRRKLLHEFLRRCSYAR